MSKENHLINIKIYRNKKLVKWLKINYVTLIISIILLLNKTYKLKNIRIFPDRIKKLYVNLFLEKKQKLESFTLYFYLLCKSRNWDDNRLI